MENSPALSDLVIDPIAGLALPNTAKDILENKFLKTLMQAPVGIVMLRGKNMMVEMANDTYLAIVDKKSNEFIGTSLYDALPEVRDAVEPILSNILVTGEPFFGTEFEVTLDRFGKKEQTFFNFVYHPVREDDQQISGIFVVATEVTAQVKAEKMLRSRDMRFQNLVNHSPIAMAVFRGPEFIIELANETLLKTLWRKKFSEVEGKKLLEIFPELLDQQFPALLRTVLQTGIVYRESEALSIVNSSDGSKRFFLDFEYAPIFETDNSVSGIMVTVNDVTEKVEARKKNENTQKLYSSLLETLPVAVFTIDKDGFVDLYNQAAITLWARTPVKNKDKWCGSHGLVTLDGIVVPHENCPMATALKENRPIKTEAYVQRPDGSLRHVIAHPQPMHDNEGNVIGAMNVLIDITDRKEAENALRRSEEKFRVLANSMPQFIWTGGPDGNLNYFSQSVFDYSGFSESKIMEEGWLEIVHPDDREKNVELWMASVVNGTAFHYEHRFRRADGVYRWQLSRAVPQRDNEGNILMWVGTSTDIHDRRLFSDELTAKVEERTKELKNLNSKLLHSNDELLQFNYVASHDLQEPLRKIQTFTSRILETDYPNLSEKGKDFFKRIERASSRTQKLIQDLLSFSRMNTVEKLFEQTDMNLVLNKVKDDLSELIDQNDAVIQAVHLPLLTGISFQMEQLFNNLIGNAIKFRKPGQSPIISITVSTIDGHIAGHPALDHSKKYQVISVRDNGIGFDPQFNERIFMVFQRLQQDYPGTGIGLAICKRIMENHEGLITASGKPGEGAVFNLYFPL